MSPILVRPVREQLEHDRIIRLLQSKCRRKYEVGMNPGSEQNAAVAEGAISIYPDLVLQSQERGHRLQAVVEVETGESVNHLEALAEWAPLARLRAEFHLYVPAAMAEVARRLCEDNHIHVHEFWSFHTFGDEVRFNLIQRSKEPVPAPRPPARPEAAAAVKRPARAAAVGRRKAATPPAARTTRGAKAAPRKAATKPSRTQKRK